MFVVVLALNVFVLVLYNMYVCRNNPEGKIVKIEIKYSRCIVIVVYLVSDCVHHSLLMCVCYALIIINKFNVPQTTATKIRYSGESADHRRI